MAAEIQFKGPTGATCYTQIRNRTSGYVWNGSSFEQYSSLSGNQATYSVAASEQGAGSLFVANFPSAIPAGTYDVAARQKPSAAFLESDPVIAGGGLEWNGAIVPPLADVVTSGQFGRSLPVKLTRGQMVQNFPIYFKSAVDHITPLTSGVVSGQIARDNGGFVSLQSGAFVEIGNGFYNLVALTSGDTDAGTAKVLFTAAGADPVPLGFVFQRVSGV